MDENEATLASYDAGVAEYLSLTPSEPSALARWLGHLVGDIFAPGARVLEVGAAGGQDARHLRECGLQVLPTDGSAGFVTHLQEHGFPEACRYDIRRDAPPVESVDIVFANAVLPHLRREDVGPALRRLCETLGDETVLFASVKIGEGEGWSTVKLGNPRWYTYWQPEEFTRTLREAGWVVEEARVRAGRFDDWAAVIAVPVRSALRDAFDERAVHYRKSDFHRAYAGQLVAEVPLEPGWTVLDVAAGTGFVSREVSRVIGPTGRVVAVDLSELMLQALSEDCRGPEPGSAPIEPVVGDAMALALADESVDAVVCGAGLLYMDPARALAEWFRVLRPGGVVAFSTMRADEPPASRLFRVHARGYGLDLSDLSARLGSEQACEEALTAAGFTGCRVSDGQVTFSERDLDRAWDVHLRMARSELATLPEEDLGRLRASYLAELGMHFREDPGFAVAKTLYAVARKP